MEVVDLLNSIDIVDYISQFVELTERNGEYWGISPFTFPPEKTPSFSVRRESHKFYDFSSGIGGSVITFVQRFFNLSSGDAIKKLQEYAGIAGEIVPARAKLSATNVCMAYMKPKAVAKVSKTTILADDYMDRYEVRPDKLAVWESEGISKASLERFQVRYDGFSDRLVYPIRNPDGKIVNVGGRTLDPRWKEKKLRKYTYFHPWGTMETIYGLAENIDFCREKHEIILFEGCKSVLIADTWGIKNTGALLTSHVSAAQLKILVKLGLNVVFALDKDVKIRDDHNIKKLKQFVKVEYIHDMKDLLKEKDSPVDEGKAVFDQLYQERFRYT